MGGEASTAAADTARHSYRSRSPASSRRVIVAAAAAAAYAHRAIATCSVEEGGTGSDKRLIQVSSRGVWSPTHRTAQKFAAIRRASSFGVAPALPCRGMGLGPLARTEHSPGRPTKETQYSSGPFRDGDTGTTCTTEGDPLAACELAETAHTRLVGDIDPNPTIRALQRKDGTWCVCATPPYGPSTYIGDFKSEVEAQNWIIHKAKDHFPRRNRPLLETC